MVLFCFIDFSSSSFWNAIRTAWRTLATRGTWDASKWSLRNKCARTDPSWPYQITCSFTTTRNMAEGADEWTRSMAVSLSSYTAHSKPNNWRVSIDRSLISFFLFPCCCWRPRYNYIAFATCCQSRVSKWGANYGRNYGGHHWWPLFRGLTSFHRWQSYMGWIHFAPCHQVPVAARKTSGAMRRHALHQGQVRVPRRARTIRLQS